MSKKPDFSGWATRNNIKCADGRTIMRDAFKGNDGQKVPLVWNHQHNSVYDVLGHAILHNRDEGVYCDCYLNDTEAGRDAKLVIEHGDITALSIYANGLKQDRDWNVSHGIIREVSLVHGGANPGAYIDSVSLSHGADIDDDDFEAIIYTGLDFELSHSSDDKEEKKEEKEDKKMDDEKKKVEPEEKTDDSKDSEETIGDVFNTLNEKQKNAVYYMIGKAAEGNNSDEEEEEKMKHNVFDNDQENTSNVLSHSDLSDFLENAKRSKVNSLREAFEDRFDGTLAHSIDTTGMDTATGHQTYGFNDPDMLFPEYKSLNNPPAWISRNMDWVSVVMNGVHHTPFSRIKSVYANITEDDARARGYIKAHQKVSEVFTTLKRTTDPQTIYKLQKLDRDDIIDITDFDVVAWIKAEMRVMLNEEIARAILIGDGRDPASEYHIQESHVRPIVSDVPLFNIKYNVAVEDPTDPDEVAKAITRGAIKARKDYKGSGNPVFFTTEDVLTDLLLLEDGIGHKLYKTEAELATSLRVSKIVTVEVMENVTVDTKPLLGVIVNLADYSVGADKGGSVETFDDFDIDFNQYKYLIETRISGALIKPYSAITLLLTQKNPG